MATLNVLISFMLLIFRVSKYANNIDVVNFGRNFSLHRNYLGEFREKRMKDFKSIFGKSPQEMFLWEVMFVLSITLQFFNFI